MHAVPTTVTHLRLTDATVSPEQRALVYGGTSTEHRSVEAEVTVSVETTSGMVWLTFSPAQSALFRKALQDAERVAIQTARAERRTAGL